MAEQEVVSAPDDTGRENVETANSAGSGRLQDQPGTADEPEHDVDENKAPPSTRESEVGGKPTSSRGDEGGAPPSSAGASTRRRDKKKGKGKGGGACGGEPAMSVEDLFVTISTVQVSGINPPPARVVLTPRSAESCLKHGVNPEILRVRDLDSFWEPGVEPEVQRMRHEAYSQRRHEMMRLCRQERKRLINAEQKASNISQNTALSTRDK
ncbi:unnamed protein product [Ectocarpus sp. 12 AP-2014]